MKEATAHQNDLALLGDAEIAARIVQGESALFEILMRRHNQRVYRATRAILGDEAEVEDSMQQAYVNAYFHLHQFAGRARFSTWLTRIAVYEALARLRRRRAAAAYLENVPSGEEADMAEVRSPGPDPERQAFGRELGSLLEEALDRLPEVYRLVFVLRELEHLPTAEVADCLGIREETVKTRLHRARAMIREELFHRVGAAGPQAFQFLGARCDRMVAIVLCRLQDLSARREPGLPG